MQISCVRIEVDVTMLYVILLVLSCLLEPNAGKRVLGFFPMPGKSQHLVFAPILQGLAERGHQVVYLTPIKPDFSHPNLDVRLMPSFLEKYHSKYSIEDYKSYSILLASHLFSKATEELRHDLYGNPAAQKIIHGSDSYDVVLMESFLTQEPVSSLIHKFGCVAVEISTLGDSAWINELSGLPDNSAYHIDFKSELTDTMSFFERLYNSYVTWGTVLVSYYHLWRMQSVMDEYFNYTGWETRPSIYKLVSNKSFILVNRDVALNYPYPEASHVKDIGGINLLPNKPLPKDLQDFMDVAKAGVIYFSLGTHVNPSIFMRSETGKAVMAVFRNLPQRIIMKLANDNPGELPPNVRTYKWIPQQDILAHKNCILFITHGGFLSLTETVFHGVPIVGIPHFFDQTKNMMQAESSGYGIRLAKDNVTQSSFSWAIQEVLSNPRFKEEVSRRSLLLREKRHSGLEEAIYWIEHAMKHPNALTPKAVELNFFQLHMIDIKLFILAVFLIIGKLVIIMIQFVKNHFIKTKKEKLN